MKRKAKSHGGFREGAGRKTMVEDGVAVATVIPAQAAGIVDRMASEAGVSRAVMLRRLILMSINGGSATENE